MSDAELLARLKAAADEAWRKSERLAKMADRDIGYRAEWLESLNAAYEASRVYQALMLPVPFVG